MRRKFFLMNLVRLLSLSLIPILIITLVVILVFIPLEKTDIQTQTNNKLALTQEVVTLLLTDCEKAMNLINIGSYANDIRQILNSSSLNYVEFLTLNQTAAYLNAIITSREYIDSIYVYIPNERENFMTNQAHIYSLSNYVEDQDLQKIFTETDKYQVIRRESASVLDSSYTKDYLSIIQRNSKGYVVCININTFYFNSLFSKPLLNHDETIMFVKDGEVLFTINDSEKLDLTLETGLSNATINNYETSGFLISESYSDTLDLNIIYAIPQISIYENLTKIVYLSFIVAFICIVICVFLSIYFTSKMSQQLFLILDILNSKNSPTIINPNSQALNKNPYNHILTNIIYTFANNDYLQVSLEKEKYRGLSLELSALQYQINPHFLLNTLQMIDFEILKISKKPIKANEMIQELSLFLQYSLRLPTNDVSLEEEIDATNHFVYLMTNRYLNQIHVNWDIDTQVLTHPIPKLILQPIIENSIKHGLYNSSYPLEIDIQLKSSETYSLIIIVSDNGIGVSSEKLTQIKNSLSSFEGFQEKHIGLQNLYRRLKLRFGTDNCLIRLNSSNGNGFTIKICITREVSIESND